MTLLNKILLILLSLTIVGAVCFVIYDRHQSAQKLDEITKSMVEQKQLLDNITRSQAQFASKDDINNFAKQNNLNLDAIKNDLNTLDATITGINNIKVVSTGQNSSNINSSNTTPRTDPDNTPGTTPVPDPKTDPLGYQTNRQTLKLSEKFGLTEIPFGEVGFSAWKKAPWDINVAQRTYNITNVLGTDSNERHYVYNKFSIDIAGKSYPINISNAKFIEEYPEAKFSFFNPRLFLGVDGGVNVSSLPVHGELSPSISIGLMSYGKSTVTPDWSFLQVGLGYGVNSQRPQAIVSPAQFNIGKNLTLIKNTYIGPSVSVGTNGQIAVGGGLRVGL